MSSCASKLFSFHLALKNVILAGFMALTSVETVCFSQWFCLETHLKARGEQRERKQSFNSEENQNRNFLWCSFFSFYSWWQGMRGKRVVGVNDFWRKKIKKEQMNLEVLAMGTQIPEKKNTQLHCCILLQHNFFLWHNKKSQTEIFR